jgi:effector-binding domain-containing protein
MSDYDVSLADLPEQHAAVVRGTVSHDGIADFLGSAFGEVAEALGRGGVEPAGAPFARYRLLDNGDFDIEAGFTVAEAVPPGGRVGPATLPGGHCARVVHRGSYDRLRAAYEAAESWVLENGFALNGDPWELYLDDPEVPEPRTEVFMPCAEAHR